MLPTGPSQTGPIDPAARPAPHRSRGGVQHRALFRAVHAVTCRSRSPSPAGYGPTPPGGVLPQGANLQRDGLLIVGGNARVEAGAKHFRRLVCLAKNPTGLGCLGYPFFGHFQWSGPHGRRGYVSALRGPSTAARNLGWAPAVHVGKWQSFAQTKMRKRTNDLGSPVHFMLVRMPAWDADILAKSAPIESLVWELSSKAFLGPPRRTNGDHAKCTDKSFIICELRLKAVIALIGKCLQVIENMERETGLEPATSSLGNWS